MKEVITKLTHLRDQESNSLSYLARYILNNYQLVKYLSLQDFVDNAYSSIYFVDQLLEFLSLANYQELKLTIANCTSSLSNQQSNDPDHEANHTKLLLQNLHHQSLHNLQLNYYSLLKQIDDIDQ